MVGRRRGRKERKEERKEMTGGRKDLGRLREKRGGREKRTHEETERLKEIEK